jgi:cation:H+ antiporter
MFGEVLFLLAGLLLILLSAEGFTNGIETFGRRFNLSQAVVGSLLAAVGTALPETILPIVAIFFYSGESAKDIGVGAILGAPFMLSTLAFSCRPHSRNIIHEEEEDEINIEIRSMKKGSPLFADVFRCGVDADYGWKVVFSYIAVVLIVGYIFYAYHTFRDESADVSIPMRCISRDSAGRLN